MSRPTRRAILGGLAAAATVGWAGAGEAATVRVSASRVRPGATLRLRCPGADGFELRFGDGAPRTVEARDGALSLAAPAGWGPRDWTPIRIVPTRLGRPIGPAAEVAVLTRPPVFGA